VRRSISRRDEDEVVDDLCQIAQDRLKRGLGIVLEGRGAPKDPLAARESLENMGLREVDREDNGGHPEEAGQGFQLFTSISSLRNHERNEKLKN
jgi:hypothetical protein